MRGRWGLLLPLLLGGCSPDSVAALVLPGQHHLAVRPPTQISPGPLPAVPPPPTVTDPMPELPSKELSLDEAIRIALANARVIRVLTGVAAAPSGQTIYDPAISNTTIDEARSVFDPVFNLRDNVTRTENPSAFFDPTNPLGVRIGGSRVDANDFGMSLSKRNVLGGTLRLDVADTFTNITPNIGLPLNPQDRSATTLSYTQPLLRGAGVPANVAPIIIARLNTERSYFQLKDSLQELVRSTAEAYWGIVFARVDVWARSKQVEQGEFALKLAEARRRRGFGTAADVAQARTGLANFRAGLIAAQANLFQREGAMRNLLRLPPAVPAHLVPITPPTSVRVTPKWNELTKLAGELRPDLIELQLIIEADRQALIQANNQARPQLDATALYRWNGLEGETPSGARLTSGPGQFTDWTLGVNFAVPLGLRADRARLRRAELILARDQVNLGQGMHAALHQLATIVRSLARDYEQYLAFKEAREAARINIEQQFAAYRAGIKGFTLLNVRQAIADWGNAVSAEAQALAQYNTDLAGLERETGTILQTHGVRLFEERFRSIGPLGRLGPDACFPAAVTPGPNAPRYPAGPGKAEDAFDLKDPASLKARPSIPVPFPDEPPPPLPTGPAPRPLPPPPRVQFGAPAAQDVRPARFGAPAGQ